MSNGNFPNGTVSVKALVWSYRNDQPAYEVCADCPFGRYAISPAGEHGYGWKQPRQNVWSGFLPTCDEAKAAAQDDYESRILSTLLPTPKLEAEPVGYVTEVELAQLRLGVSCIDLFGKVVPKGFAMVPLYAHPPKPEPVGWETDAEWVLEMRCANITENTPFDEVSKLINDLWQQYCLAAEPKPEATEGGAHGKASIASLDERMVAAGMLPLSALLSGETPLKRWSAHTGVSDLSTFQTWLSRRYEEFMRMKVAYELGDKPKDDELYEWVLSHCGALGEVVANFRQMKERMAEAALTAKPTDGREGE